MTPLTVICWRWKPQPNYRSTFGAETVRVLRNMVARNYSRPHRFVCVTDDPKSIDSDIETIRDFGDFVDVGSPHGRHQPSCYRRLRLFSADAGKHFGPRFVSLDLDTVIVGDITALWDRTEDFICWGEQNPRSFYNGSMFMLNAGARRQVWETFNPRTSPHEAKRAGRFGSDQGIISHVLGRGEATWGRTEGVYSYRVDIYPKRNQLPGNAKMVMFHGKFDPWMPEMKRIPFVAEHYQ